MALLPGSPAIGAGSTALAVDGTGNPLSSDQRGQPRIIGGTLDIGAYQSSGLAGTSSGATYSLSDGTLDNTQTKQVIASNVVSFAQGTQGELCYLQIDGDLWFYGDDLPLASGVASFAIDGSGTVLYLGLNGVLNAITVQQPLDTGTPIVLFKMDGDKSAVVLDHEGNLIRYTPGSETPTLLDSTQVDGTTVVSSVLTFALDSTGAIVVLDSNGDLTRYAAGSDAAELLDTGVSRFAIDGAGSIVALDNAETASVTLANGQAYSTQVYDLVRFLAGSGGSLVKDVLDTGVAAIMLDGADSVVALDDLSQSSVTLANGRVFSTPAYSMIRFAPGSTSKQALDSGVTQVALDGAGSVVALDSLTQTSPLTLGNGQDTSTPVYTMVNFGPDSTQRRVLDSGVSRFAVDGAGTVVALDSLSVTDKTLTNGNTYSLWNIASFAAPSYSRQVMDQYGVVSFLVDGSGTVVVLDDLSLNTSFEPVVASYELARLLPGPAPGAYTRQLLSSGLSSQPVRDASGALFVLSGGALIRFASGSDEGIVVAEDVSRIAVDGSGSVVALDSPSTLTLNQAWSEPETT
jgi:hypothetical protein